MAAQAKDDPTTQAPKASEEKQRIPAKLEARLLMEPQEAVDIIKALYPERYARGEIVPRINNKHMFLGARVRDCCWLTVYGRRKIITKAQHEAGKEFIDRLPRQSYEMKESLSSVPIIPNHLPSALHTLLSPVDSAAHRRAIIHVCVFDLPLAPSKLPWLRAGLRQLVTAYRI